MISEQLVKVFQFIDTYRERMIDDLRDAISLKSVSGSYEHNVEIEKMIKWTEKWLKKLKATTLERFDIGSYSVDGKTLKLPTVILATFGKDKKKKTVCIYCRIDVKNVDNFNGWCTDDPWKLTEMNGQLYGRGCCKGKTPLMNWFHCIEAFQQQRVNVPVNLKFIIEGMYEMNSLGLEDFLYTQRITFLKNIDYICVNESEWINKTIPCLSYGTCGICQYEIICSGGEAAAGDIGEMFNVNQVMDYIFKNSVDEVGNILIPKINEDVEQITQEGEKSLDDVICDLTLIKKNLPNYMQCWSKQKILMRLWQLPAFLSDNINEIDCNCDSGTSDNVAAGRGDNTNQKKGIKRKFLLKIVPVQTPDRSNLFVMEHIKNLIEFKFNKSNNTVVTKISNGNKRIECKILNNNKNEIGLVSCKNISATRPWKENSVSSHYEAAKKAVDNVFKEQPNVIRESSDLPIILVLQKVIGKSMILMPLSNNEQDDNYANECISMRNYFEGKKLLAAYLFELAAIK